jgi:hypothetical protein
MFRNKGKFLWVITTIGVLLIMFNSCKKDPNNPPPKDPNQTDTTQNDSASQAYIEQMFALLVLDKKIRVVLAVDSSGKNITPTYDNHDIFLRKETFYKGPLEIFANGTKYEGTWESNKDYSLLDLKIKGLPEFEFYETLWRFTMKSVDLLRIAPVQNPGQKQLHLKKV